MDKFVLPAHKKRTAAGKELVRLTPEAYGMLLEMTNESTLPMRRIASAAIAFAYEHLELIREEG
ncbi:MAG: hypothetical protein ACI4F8_05315 [Lachnospiraceae bacterium]